MSYAVSLQILIGLRNALELAVSTKSLANKISLGVEVGLITNQLAENLAASVLVQETSEGVQRMVKGISKYRNDVRQELSVATQLRYSETFVSKFVPKARN